MYCMTGSDHVPPVSKPVYAHRWTCEAQLSTTASSGCSVGCSHCYTSTSICLGRYVKSDNGYSCGGNYGCSVCIIISVSNITWIQEKQIQTGRSCGNRNAFLNQIKGFKLVSMNFFCFADRTPYYNLSQWPTWCTNIFNTFVTILCMFMHLVSSLSVSDRPVHKPSMNVQALNFVVS
jgi:hypothetical protein